MSAMSWPMLGQRIGGRIGEHHLVLKPIDTSEAKDALRAAETMYQLAMLRNPQEVEMSHELLIFPEGEGDVVTITERDMEGLQPGRFLSNNIVDFYIRYLERTLPPEYGECFYFFNSFFLTKLLESTAHTGIGPCKVDYEKVRNWTKGANLFDKDYVFIPIFKSSHWSLVIICNLRCLTCAPDETMRFPYILHLDPIQGQHESFEDLIRSYILQAWMGRFEVSSNTDQLLVLCQMKYVQVKVPQQDNSHDCGLYVLNYIEAFLAESNSPDFSFASSDRGPHFTSPHFEAEVVAKRRHIQSLILDLSRISQARARKCRAIKDLAQELMQTSQKLQALLEDEGNSEACIKDMQTDGPPGIFNGQGSEIKHATTHEDAMDAQHLHSGWISRLANKPLNGLEVGQAEHQTTESLSGNQYAEPGKIPCMELSEPFKGKNKRGRNMTEEETWVLLSCKLKGGRFCKGSGGATHWNLICEEIERKLGTKPSQDQCRLRYDTLLKAYKAYKKYCLRTGKTFSEIMEGERLELKLATTLREKWYTTIDEICDKAESQKRIKLNPGVCNDLDPLSAHDSPPPSPLPISNERSLEDGADTLDGVCGTGEVLLGKVIHPIWFRRSTEDLQYTLLNLVQECSWTNWQCVPGKMQVRNGFDLERVCQRLAIVQDREPGEIRKYVLKLWRFDFVKFWGLNPSGIILLEEGKDPAQLDLCQGKIWFLKSELHEEISKQVLCKYPHLKTYYIHFPIEQSSVQYVKVLNLIRCEELEHLDLREFPNLRSLTIRSCPKFNFVTGWEVATGLGSLDIGLCDSYHDFPNVQYLFSLREFQVSSRRYKESAIPWQFSQFSQCVKLRRVVVDDDKSFSESVDFKNLNELKFLEFLSIVSCSISSIQGLSALQGLTELRLRHCRALERVLELGCLKRLTYLDLSFSSVVDVVGVEELLLLTSLELRGCKSLTWLPFLGHLEALNYVDVSQTAVKVIPGTEHFPIW